MATLHDAKDDGSINGGDSIVTLDKDFPNVVVSAGSCDDNESQQNHGVVNPQEWSLFYKWSITGILSMLTAMVQLSTIIAAPVAPQILQKFHSDSTINRTLIVSIWELGEVFCPLLWGPLSEEIGRWPMMNISNLCFCIFSFGAAMSRSLPMLIAFRFLTGACSTSAVIGPGIIGDMFDVKHRGQAMSFYQFSAAFGPIVGPVAGSYLGQKAGWRWAFWLPMILNAFLSLVFLALYRESYLPILERKQAKKAAKMEGAAIDGQTHSKLQAFMRILRAPLRPLKLLVTSYTLLSMTAYSSLINGLVYLVFCVIAPVFQDEYHFSEGASGLTFLGLVLGLVIGSLFCAWALRHFIARQLKSRGGQLTPEVRMPPMILAGIVLPCGFFLFGWTAQYKVQWMAPITGTALIGFAYVAIQICIRTYLVDAFDKHSVSAMSAMLIPFNFTATVLPLAGPPLYEKLGLGWGNSVFGFIALAFVPVPLLFLAFGAALRRKDRLAQS